MNTLWHKTIMASLLCVTAGALVMATRPDGAPVPLYGPATTGMATLAQEAPRSARPTASPTMDPAVRAVVTRVNPVARTLQMVRDLVGRGDEDALYQLKSLLASPEAPEGLAVARRLLQDDSPALRRVGADIILSGFSLNDPGIHAMVVGMLRDERDSGVLLHILDKLDAPANLYGNDAEMTGALHGLLGHADPDVRAQTILQLLQWDENDNLDPYLYQALNDSAPKVRLSATAAAGLAGSHSNTLRAALLNIGHNPLEASDLRDSALNALQHFDTE